MPCDYDGDGAIDPAIYRPSTGLWFGTRANGSTVVLNTNLGRDGGRHPGARGLQRRRQMRPGDHASGRVAPAAPNLWYSVPSGGGPAFQIYFGAVGIFRHPGDYDGDGKADAVIYRPSSGLWLRSADGGGSIVIQLTLGQNGDIPRGRRL